MAGIKIVDLPALGRDLINTDLLEVSLNGGGSRKITGQEIMNASKLAIGSTPIVSGTVGRLLFQGTGDVLQQSSSLFWDNTNGTLTINPLITNPSGFKVGLNIFSDAVTRMFFTSSATGANWNAGMTISSGTSTPRWTIAGFGSTFDFTFYNETTASTALFIKGSTNNVLINTTTDAGFRLDVNGTARVSGLLTLNNNIEFSSYNRTIANSSFPLSAIFTNQVRSLSDLVDGGGTNGITFSNNGGAIRGRIYGTTGNWYIGSSPTDDGFRLDVNGTARVSGATLAVGDWTSRSTNVYVRAATGGSELRGFLIGYGASNDGNAGSFTYNPTGNFLNIRSPYNNGTIALSFEGNTNSTQFHNTSGVVHSKIVSSTGNWLINTTTDAGFRLDVNGTARVQGGFTIDSTTAPVFRGVNPLTGTTNATSGGLLLTNQTGVTAMGIAGTYGGAGSRLTLFNNYTDPTTSRIKINLGGVDTACFFADGSLQIGNGETTIASAILSASSTTRGFLPPRMTNAQRAAIASPAVGLIVYCTDATEGLYVYKSTGWTFMV